MEWPKARARPNVEVNRRAEGTSELNRRLGAVEKGAAALERCGAAGDYDRGWAGWQAACCAVALQESKRCVPVSFHETKQEASNRVASPEREDVECASRVASPKPKAVERRHPTEA